VQRKETDRLELMLRRRVGVGNTSCVFLPIPKVYADLRRWKVPAEQATLFIEVNEHLTAHLQEVSEIARRSQYFGSILQCQENLVSLKRCHLTAH